MKNTFSKTGFATGLKKISLTLGIAVLFALFVGFAIDAFYASPKYEDYCKNMNTPYSIPEKLGVTNCTPINYSSPMFLECQEKKGYIEYNYNTGCPTNPRCETCGMEYDNANKIYSRNLFLITAAIGIIAIISGLVFISLDAIASGFMFGGIFIIIYGTARVFGNLSKFMRVIVLGLELVLLVYIGIWKSKE